MFRRLLLTALLVTGTIGAMAVTPLIASAETHHGSYHHPASHGPRHDSHHRRDWRSYHDHGHPRGYHQNYGNLSYNQFWKLVALGRIPRP